MENWYRLSKAELSHLSKIEEPVICLGKRISKPVVVVLLGTHVLYVWSLKWYKYKVKQGGVTHDEVMRYEIHHMY